ncbi:MAG: hypothetical protein JWM16_2271 [Verrucomicrobiales bacterium]|jgi:hypothetical protein|nr:hypothetical protein [Verrucomicrobiales bacterium]
MSTATKPALKVKSKQRARVTVLDEYDTSADDKKRISLRGAPGKYFHVKALSDGSYILEPRFLVAREAISPRSLKTLEQSVANLKKGKASSPIDLGRFSEE